MSPTLITSSLLSTIKISRRTCTEGEGEEGWASTQRSPPLRTWWISIKLISSSSTRAGSSESHLSRHHHSNRGNSILPASSLKTWWRWLVANKELASNLTNNSNSSSSSTNKGVSIHLLDSKEQILVFLLHRCNSSSSSNSYTAAANSQQVRWSETRGKRVTAHYMDYNPRQKTTWTHLFLRLTALTVSHNTLKWEAS